MSSIDALHVDLRLKFDRLRRIGVKFSLKAMSDIAIHLIYTSRDDAYHASEMHPDIDELIITNVTTRSVQSFCERFQIVSRQLTGKLQLRP